MFFVLRRQRALTLCLNYMTFTGGGLLVFGALMVQAHRNFVYNLFFDAAPLSLMMVLILGTTFFLLLHDVPVYSRLLSDHNVRLITYGLLAFVIFTAELAVILSGTVMRDRVALRTRHIFRQAIEARWAPGEIDNREWIHSLQRQFQCCGFDGPEDWHKLRRHGRARSARYAPRSCCAGDCGAHAGAHADRLHADSHADKPHAESYAGLHADQNVDPHADTHAGSHDDSHADPHADPHANLHVGSHVDPHAVNPPGFVTPGATGRHARPHAIPHAGPRRHATGPRLHATGCGRVVAALLDSEALALSTSALVMCAAQLLGLMSYFIESWQRNRKVTSYVPFDCRRRS